MDQWLGSGGQAMKAAGLADPLTHVAAKEWTLRCNWKVFVDNYLVSAVRFTSYMGKVIS